MQYYRQGQNEPKIQPEMLVKGSPVRARIERQTQNYSGEFDRRRHQEKEYRDQQGKAS
jgi:hypothetical protein